MGDEEMSDVESESDGEDGCAEFRGTIQPYMFEPKNAWTSAKQLLVMQRR